MSGGEPVTRPAENVLADLAENVAEVRRINARLEELRRERHELCRQAVEVGAVGGACSILKIDSWRVLQMRDMALMRRR